MKMNPIQFQKGFSLMEFMTQYGTENQCTEVLFQARWPWFSVSRLWRLSLQPGQNSPTVSVHVLSSSNLIDERYAVRTNQTAADGVVSGDSFADSGQNLLVGIGLETASRRVENIAWNLKHKIMQVMKARDDSKPLAGIFNWMMSTGGGEHHGGKRGRGAENKTTFVSEVALNDAHHSSP